MHLNKYRNLENTIIFMECTLPGSDRGRLLHLRRLFFIFSTKGLKLAIWRKARLRVMFKPRYLTPELAKRKGTEVCLIWQAKSFIGYNSLFLKFNLYPGNEHILTRIYLIVGEDATGSFTYNKRSSAYSDTRCSISPRRPCKSGDVFNAMESGSIAIAKSKGESGPWCVPLVREKYGERIAFVLTHACGDEY